MRPDASAKRSLYRKHHPQEYENPLRSSEFPWPIFALGPPSGAPAGQSSRLHYAAQGCRVAWGAQDCLRVPDDYHVEYLGSYYSVPHQYRGHLVDQRATNSTLEVVLNRQCIACHVLRDEPGRSTLQDHMPIAHLRQNEQDPELLLEWAESIGKNVLTWVKSNLQQRRDYANALKSVRNLRRWAREEQIHDRLDSACGFALKLGALSFPRLRSVIVNRSDLRLPIESTARVKDHDNLRGPEYYMPRGGKSC
jgi:hypothetical protein